MWPRFMSRLGRLRTPYAASLVIGAIAAAVAVVGWWLHSYISSSGYLFVVFWASLAMIRRKQRPGLPGLQGSFSPGFPASLRRHAQLWWATAWKPLLFGRVTAL